MENEKDFYNNYQLFNERYFIYEKDGIIKEYKYGLTNNKKLIFEGEYLSGKRIGKGKEYNDKGKLIFEGDYKNGEKNGLGKEYGYEDDDYPYVKYIGEYLNGERNGKGREYDSENKLKIYMN